MVRHARIVINRLRLTHAWVAVGWRIRWCTHWSPASHRSTLVSTWISTTGSRWWRDLGGHLLGWVLPLSGLHVACTSHRTTWWCSVRTLTTSIRILRWCFVSATKPVRYGSHTGNGRGSPCGCSPFRLRSNASIQHRDPILESDLDVVTFKLSGSQNFADLLGDLLISRRGLL